jgi:hypothetical protein
MLTIKRSCSYKIITRAVQMAGQPLVALLLPGGEDCKPCLDQHQFQVSLDANPEAIIVYNQQADAQALVEKLEPHAAQIYIEIRQDTKGVLGLHAFHRQGKKPETLELIYQ